MVSKIPTIDENVAFANTNYWVLPGLAFVRNFAAVLIINIIK